MGLTVLATTYFGWHYIADDIYGAIIAFVAFYIGGLATGQKFDEHGRHTHPTTTTLPTWPALLQSPPTAHLELSPVTTCA